VEEERQKLKAKVLEIEGMELNVENIFRQAETAGRESQETTARKPTDIVVLGNTNILKFVGHDKAKRGNER